MNKITIIFIVLISTIGHGKETENSLLWKVSSPTTQQPSYIYATWHLLCRNEMVFKQKVKVAISKTEQLLMQNFITYVTDEDFFERMKTHEKVFNDLPIYKIDDRKKRKKLLKLIDDHLDLKYNRLKRVGYAVKRMTPLEVFFASMHSFIRDCGGMRSFEQMLFDHYQKNEKRIGAFNDRQSFYQSLLGSGFMQVDSLIDYLQDIESQQAMVQNMKVHYYVDEDLSGLKDLYRIFLNNDHVEETAIDRHILNIDVTNWINKIDRWIQQKPTFITVNASYLTGPQGVLAELRELGYQVDPVY